MALRDRKINNFVELRCPVALGDLEISVLSIRLIIFSILKHISDVLSKKKQCLVFGQNFEILAIVRSDRLKKKRTLHDLPMQKVK